MRPIAAVVCSLALAGCAATGVKVSEDQARAFRVGASTYGDVVGALGAPTTSTMSADGTRMATYSYAAARAQPQNFIPYIGPLVSGYDMQSSAVVFTFDARGILTGTTSSQTGMATGTNLAAGSAAASAPYQGVR